MANRTIKYIRKSSNTEKNGDDYKNRSVTFNGGELLWLFEPTPEIKQEWERRLICALCFAKNFFSDNGVSLPEVPYKIYVGSSFTEIKSLLFERSGGRYILQPNAASAPFGGALYAEQKAMPIMDIHEYIHIIVDTIVDNLKKERKGETSTKPILPMWYLEGLAQYIQSKKDGVNYFGLARMQRDLPPFILGVMNIPTEKFWMEFGIMDQLIATGNHPGLTACASFVQFLIEKEGIGFKNFWDLVYFEGDLAGFYKKIEELSGSNLYNILNNYLYYVDKPFIPRDQKIWEMPVAIARDFRGKFAFENKKFEIIDLWQSL